MNRLTLVIIITILLCAVPESFAQGSDKKSGDKSSSKAASHVKVKYDKGKNLTIVTSKSMDLGGSMTRESTNLSQVTQLTLDLSFTYPGEQKTKPVESITMRFTSRAKYPVFQRAQNLMAVIDEGTAIPLGGTSYKTDAQTFYMDEIFEIAVSYEAIKRIAGAISVSFYLGNREIKFRTEVLDDLREMAARMSS